MSRKGFTLVELLLAVTVLVVLGLAVLTLLNPMMQIFKGYDTIRKTDLASINAAFESYYEDHGCYPPQTILDNCGSADLSPYINAIPCDPNTHQPYVLYNHLDSSCPQKYAIYTTLSNPLDPEADDIEYCDNTYAIRSSGITDAVLSSGCSDMDFCPDTYGCVNGVCTLVATDTFNVCNGAPGFCGDPTCRGYCGPADKECFR